MSKHCRSQRNSCFLFFCFLRSSISVELLPAPLGPCHARALQRSTIVLYINIHLFQSVSTETYRWQTQHRQGDVEIYENGWCLCFDSGLNHSVEINHTEQKGSRVQSSRFKKHLSRQEEASPDARLTPGVLFQIEVPRFKKKSFQSPCRAFIASHLEVLQLNPLLGWAHLTSRCSCSPKWRVQQGTAGQNTRQTEGNNIIQIFCQKKCFKIFSLTQADEMMTTKTHQWTSHCGNSAFYQDYTTLMNSNRS